jgi:hypothetical protein
MWLVAKDDQDPELSGAEAPSFRPADTLVPWMARPTRRPGGALRSARGRLPLRQQWRQRSARRGRRDWRSGIVGPVTLDSAMRPATRGRVRRSYVPWLVASLLVIGLLPACSSGIGKKSAVSSGGIPLVSQDVGPLGMTVHFQGGWINEPFHPGYASRICNTWTCLGPRFGLERLREALTSGLPLAANEFVR